MEGKLTTRLIETLRPQEKPYEVRDSDIKGLILRVQPTGRMIYYCEFRTHAGRKNRVKIGAVEILSIAQARDEAIKLSAEVAIGEDPAQRRKKEKLSSLSIFLKEAYAPWARSQQKRADDNLDRIEKLFPEFLSLTLDRITVLSVQRWINARRSDGIQPATINRNIALLKSVLSRAVEWDVLPRHPLKGIKPMRVDSRGIVRFLSNEEEIRLLNALDSREERIRIGRESANTWRSVRGQDTLPSLNSLTFKDHLKPMVLLSAHTGIRQGEMFSLRWGDIDFKNTTLTVHGKNAKSGQTRQIRLNTVALSALREWKKQQPLSNEFVFTGENENAFNNVKKSWGKLLIDAKISSFRWHDLRHHFASKLVMAGVDLNTVRELLGHSDIKMTLRYAHLSPTIKQNAVELLTRKIFPLSDSEYA